MLAPNEAGQAEQPAIRFAKDQLKSFVERIEKLEEAHSSLAIALGDFRRGYLVVDRAGVRLLRDPFTAKPYVLFSTSKRGGGGVRDFDAIKVLKFAAS
jgi:HK97 family phage major capsid protein